MPQSTAMDTNTVYKRNFRTHLLEGSLYLSTNAILYTPILFPALITRLGGNNTIVGLFPVMVYFAFLLPQVLSARYIRTKPYRKPTVVTFGWIQRFLILLMALVVAVFGREHKEAGLVLLISVFTLNQAVSGITSPAWFDLVAKTTRDRDRGKLMGLRVSGGSLLGLFNGVLLVFLLSWFEFPLNYSAAIFIAFLFQLWSLFFVRKLIEQNESAVEAPLSYSGLWREVKGVLERDAVFRRFLISSALLTVGLVPMGFFMVGAIARFSLDESFVGWFTMTISLTQIFSGILLGLLADNFGYRFVLFLCGGAMGIASIIAFFGNHYLYYFGVFFLVGIYLGGEFMTRYNFSVEFASERNRALYVGLMNAWLAPCYGASIVGGWLVDQFGYNVVFLSGFIFTLSGLVLLSRTPDPRTAKLALSSN